MQNSINNSRSGLRQNTFKLNTTETLNLDEKKGGSLIFLDCSVNNLKINLPPVNDSRGIFFNFIVENVDNGATINFYAFDETDTAETKIKIKQHADSVPVDNYTITINTATRNWIGENFQIVSDGEYWFITNLSYNETFEILEDSDITLVSGNTDGNVFTVSGDNEISGESNLTFDGSQLIVKGNISLREDITNTNQVVSFQDNKIVTTGNIEGCDVKTSNAFNDYWIQKGLDIDGESDNDQFGYSIAMSANGKFLAVGSPYHDGSKGLVRVYKFLSGNWTQIGSDLDGEAAGDTSGFSVSINNDGDIVAIGAPENNAGHVCVFQYNGTDWVQLSDDIDGEAEDDKSGFSVSLNYKGDIVAIGAPENNGTADNAGHVRVYQWNGVDSWVKLGDDIDGAALNDKSGSVVSLNALGDIVAIGSPNHDADKGHVRIYQYNGVDTWVKLGLDIDGKSDGDLFGTKLQLSANGKTVVIGTNGINPGYVKAYEYSSTGWGQIGSNLSADMILSISLSADARYISIGNLITGNVIIYYWNNYFWKAVGSSFSRDTTGDRFGSSVSLSGDGNVLAVGTPLCDNTGTDMGKVRVFSRCNNIRNISAITQKNSKIITGVTISAPSYTIDFSEVGDAVYTINNAVDNIEISLSNAFKIGQTGFIIFKFGANVPAAMTFKSGVGWYRPDAGSGTGVNTITTSPNGVQLYNYYILEESKVFLHGDFTNWVKLGQDIDGEAEQDGSGGSVSLSSDGKIVAIGATGNDDNGNISGHVRVYEYNGVDTWVKLGQDIDGEAAVDQSGHSVSLSSDGKTVAIGAIGNDDNGNGSGHVGVYEYNGVDTWVQLGQAIDQDIDGEAAGDQSGYSVSLSNDGLIVAIGAIFNNGGNGDDSGHVRVYEYDGVGNPWVQLGDDIDGEAANDQSGYSVSLSSDGTIVAIGANVNDGNGNASGHVRVYEYDGVGDTWVKLGDDIDGEAANDSSGTSVSLSNDGTIVAIGAIGNDGDNGVDSGHVRVYEYNGVDTWVQLGLDIDGEAASDFSGKSVSLSSDGKIVAIGADFNDGNGSVSGHVRVYEYFNGTLPLI